MYGTLDYNFRNMVYYELGRVPLYSVRKLRIFKYLCKLLNTDNCILTLNTLVLNFELLSVTRTLATKTCCLSASLVQIVKIGLPFKKKELRFIGMYNYWLNGRNLKVKVFLINIRQRLYDNFKQDCESLFISSPKCIIYQHVVDNFCVQNYLTKPFCIKFKKAISRLRMSK